MLEQRLEKGIKRELLELVSVRGIGRVRARILVDNGVNNIRDLRNASAEFLQSLPTFGPGIAREIIKQLQLPTGRLKEGTQEAGAIDEERELEDTSVAGQRLEQFLRGDRSRRRQVSQKALSEYLDQ